MIAHGTLYIIYYIFVISIYIYMIYIYPTYRKKHKNKNDKILYYMANYFIFGAGFGELWII